MEIKNEYIMRNIAGDDVLVPIGKTINNFNGLYVPKNGSKTLNFQVMEYKSDDS